MKTLTKRALTLTPPTRTNSPVIFRASADKRTRAECHYGENSTAGWCCAEISTMDEGDPGDGDAAFLTFEYHDGTGDKPQCLEIALPIHRIESALALLTYAVQRARDNGTLPPRTEPAAILP